MALMHDFAQAASNRRTCFALCTAVRLPLATLFMVSLSCRTLWPRLTLARLPRASHRRSVLGRQHRPLGLLAFWSHPKKRLSIRAKESHPHPPPSSTPCGACDHLYIRYLSQ